MSLKFKSVSDARYYSETMGPGHTLFRYTDTDCYEIRPTTKEREYLKENFDKRIAIAVVYRTQPALKRKQMRYVVGRWSTSRTHIIEVDKRTD